MGLTGFSADKFLGGKLTVRQPERGFRSGLDAVMLAAAVPAKSGDSILELGSGVGVASLCLAARVSGCDTTGVEIDPALVQLANENADANELSTRVRFVAADIADLPGELRREFDHVFCNPPFHGDNGERSPDENRARATHAGDLRDWLRIGLKRTVSNGTFTTILRADRLGEAMDALSSDGPSIFPLWPKQGEPAKRVILQMRKNARAPLRLAAGLILHHSDGRPTKEADAILRDGAALLI